MKSPKTTDKTGRVSLRLLLGITSLALLPVLLWADTNGPAWWRTRGIQNTTAAANDYAAVNQGQVKNIAVKAIAELDQNLSQFGGAGTSLDQLAVTLSGTTASTNDYAAVNLGQLKTVAKPFYDRLLEVGYRSHPLESGTYPWLSSTNANDYAMANIGQVKNLFSFDVALCSDGSGLPDWWRQLYNIPPGTTGTSGAPRGDGLSYWDAYHQGLNPIDYFNGQTPTLTITNGNSQTGSPGSFLLAPLAVSVTGSSGAPLANAPVTFTVTQGGGTLQATTGGANAGALTLRTNPSGYAIVYFQLPNTQSTQCMITCAPTTGSYSASVVFTASSDDGTGDYPPGIPPPDNGAGSGNRPTPPVVSYVVQDISSGIGISGTITSIALGDDNTAAFLDRDSGGAMARIWSKGVISNNWLPSISYDDPEGTLEYGPLGVTPDGTIYGGVSKTPWDWPPSTAGSDIALGTPLPASFGFKCVNSEVTEADDGNTNFTLPTQNQDAGAHDSSGIWAFFSNGYCGWSSYGSTYAEWYTYGDNETGLVAEWGVTADNSSSYNFIYRDKKITTWTSSGYLPFAMNDNGYLLGSGSNGCGVWNGSQWISFGNYCYFPAINNNNQVIGKSSPSQSFLYNATSNANIDLASLIPTDYQGQISGIKPRQISNSDSKGVIHILFDATFIDPNNASTSQRTYVLSGPANSLSSANCILQEAQLPAGLIDYTDSYYYNYIYPIKCINANGVMAAIGSNKPLLLLPIQLTDIKKEANTSDDVTISPKATVTEQKDASITWIEPHGAADGIAPEMPHLVLNFPGTESMGLHVQWKLTVKYNRPRGDSPNEQRIKAQDEVYIPYASDSNSQPWQEQSLNGQVKIYQHSDWLIALQSDGFFGGEAKLTYQLLKSDGSPLTSEQTLLFSIGGKNPVDGTCASYITTTCNNADSHLWFSYAIAKHESKSYNGENSFYNQFWEGYATRYGVNHRKGDPLWCKRSSEESAGGFGIFQITGDAAHGKYYNIGRDRLWNWQANVSAYIGIMKTEGYNSKMQTASRFFDAVEAYYATPPYEAPPADCTNSANVWHQMSAYDADVITLYNGAGGANKTVLGTKTFTNPWKFYPENASGWKWYYYINTDINNNNYLQSVIEQF